MQVEFKVATKTVTSESRTWNYLIKRFTKEQTAGIMGNLMQENKFRTSGDGLAQWNGNRLAQLKQRGNWQDLNVQLDYMMYELHGTEKTAYDTIKASKTVYGATVAFQNLFERCGVCRQDLRLQYAQEYIKEKLWEK